MARNKYPEETVRKILDTAERLFIETGYDRASLQEIIDETGLSKGAIYHHFASKEDIFYAVCDRIGQRNAGELVAVRDGPSLNGLEKLRTIFRECVTSFDVAQNIVVLKTMPGLASAAGAAMDGMELPDLVGSLAGDDTAILIMRTNEAAVEFCEEIREMLK